MTEFEKKRLAFLIKAANRSEWIQVAPGDADLFEEYIRSYNNGHDKGFEEGIEYVVSGEMAYDEQKEDALKGTY